MSTLFEPFALKSVTLRNRVGISPMCQYSAVDGMAADWHLAHYGARAAGGAGLVIIEATAVEARGRITAGDLGLWSDAQVEPLARVCRFIKARGAVAGIQIAHAGRKASAAPPWLGGGHVAADAPGGWEIMGPSPLAFGGALGRVPREMGAEDIRAAQSAFAAAARRALAAGVEWLEIHAAHGYLAHSFCSPLSNIRADGHGGVFENRIRFLMETVAGVRAAWPGRLPLAVRISATDWADARGGWAAGDSVELAKRLGAAGVDVVDTSSGGGVHDAQVPAGPGYQVPFAGRIRREAGIATAAVGLITGAAQADAIIRAGDADLVLIGRESLRDPGWPQRAARELGADMAPLVPPQYARAW